MVCDGMNKHQHYVLALISFSWKGSEKDTTCINVGLTHGGWTHKHTELYTCHKQQAILLYF